MIRQCKTISLFAAFLWLVGATDSFALAQEKKTFVAYSMKVAQARVEQAVKQGIDWRKKEPDLFYLGGITKPLAVVVDAKTGDWMLVGERDPKSSVLTLDDWVVALRARFIHGEKDPGVTIDPVCSQESIKEGCRDYTRQEVRFFGGIENTHFGQVCYEADWLMKRIGLGLEKLPIEKLETYHKLSLEQHQKAGRSGTRVRSRFWFYPIVNRVNVLGDVVLLEKFQMGIFTEVLHAEMDGKPVADVEKFEHYPSEGFSRSFSENYDAAAEVQEVLETLRGLTRLAALGKGLTQADQKPNVEFYLKDYPMERVETPKEKEMLKVENREVRSEISGGVELMALALRLKGGDVSALKGLVLKTRPSEVVLSWEIEIQMIGGQVAGIFLPDGLANPNQIALLFAQARFLQQKKRYDAAIEGYGKVLQLNPNFVIAYYGRADVYYIRGDAYADKDDYERAIADYDKAVALGLNYARVYNGRGLAYAGKRNYDYAIADYNKAITLNPNFAGAYNNRAGAYAGKGMYDRAIADYDKTLILYPNSAGAYNNRGVAHGNKGLYDLAITDFNRAIVLNPSDAASYTNRGVAYHHKQEYERAIADYNKAIALNPNYAMAYSNRGVTYRSQDKYDLAIADFNQAITLNPRSTDAYNNRGITYDDKGLYDLAITDFNQAIALEPNDATIYTNRGVAYARKGSYDLAIADFSQAITLNPSYTDAYDNRGVAYKKKGLYDLAIADFNQAITLNPSFARAYYNKGLTYEATNRFKEAVQAYEKFMEVAPVQQASLIYQALQKMIELKKK